MLHDAVIALVRSRMRLLDSELAKTLNYNQVQLVLAAYRILQQNRTMYRLHDAHVIAWLDYQANR
jgi:hypothetical protein